MIKRIILSYIIASFFYSGYAQIILGQQLPVGAVVLDTKGDVLISASQFTPSSNVLINGVNYSAVLNKKGQVTFITTADPHFLLNGKMKVGDNYKQVKQYLKKSRYTTRLGHLLPVKF